MREKAHDQWIKPEGLKKIDVWASQGLINAEIATMMGIEPEALEDWLHRDSDISDTLKRARTREGVELTVRVKDALYRAAIGYDVPDEQLFKTKRIYWDRDGRKCEAEEIKGREIMKPRPGEPAAMIYWLEHYGTIPGQADPTRHTETE